METRDYKRIGTTTKTRATNIRVTEICSSHEMYNIIGMDIQNLFYVSSKFIGICTLLVVSFQVHEQPLAYNNDLQRSIKHFTPKLPNLIHHQIYPTPFPLPLFKHHQIRIRLPFQYPLNPLQAQHPRRRPRNSPQRLWHTSPAPIQEIIDALHQANTAPSNLIAPFQREFRAALHDFLPVAPRISPIGQAHKMHSVGNEDHARRVRVIRDRYRARMQVDAIGYDAEIGPRVGARR
jgi:hypothetical protein